MVFIWEKALFLTQFSQFLVTREKTQTFLQPIPHLQKYTYFCLPIMQKLRIYHVWFLFGATPGVDSYLRHFGEINK